MKPAEFVEALLSISVQQDFTGYGYRDASSSADATAAKRSGPFPAARPCPSAPAPALTPALQQTGSEN